MTMQSNQEQGGLLHSAAGQMTLMCVAAVAVLIVAWLYVF